MFDFKGRRFPTDLILLCVRRYCKFGISYRDLEEMMSERGVADMRGMTVTPWLVHELRNLGLEIVCLDARHARAALKMQINKTDQNDAEGLAQIVRTGWYRSVHVKSFESHRLRALLGARTQLVGMTTRLSNHIRGVLKTFGLLPGAMRGLPFDRKVEALVLNRSDVALIVRPLLVAWRQVREQIGIFDKAIRVLVKSNSACRLLMSVPGIGVLSALAYVSTVEDPGRFGRSRSVGAHLGLTPDNINLAKSIAAAGYRGAATRSLVLCCMRLLS